MYPYTTSIIAALLPSSVATAADPVSAPNRVVPKVVLLGDSIRMSYAAVVTYELAGKANVVSPAPNGEDSVNELNHLDEWAICEQPAVVHFNCGIHDVKTLKATGKFQVSPEDYAANLRKIVERLRTETKAQVAFALTTPLIDERAAQWTAHNDFELFNASVEQYNQIALRVMAELVVPVNDLRAALGDQAEQARLISGDGVHLTAEGSIRLGRAVAAFITKHLPAEHPSGR